MSRCDDYCCNHGCNQGRDCPARVAKVGRKIPVPDLQRGSIWRRHLRELARVMLYAIGVSLIATAITGLIR